MVSSSLRTRLFEDSDLDSLMNHYAGSTGRRMTRERFEWQYKRNPASRGDPPGFVCEEDPTGEFVGCIMSTPWAYRRGDESYYCTIGSDAFVRPEYRKMGVYNLMAEYVLGEGVRFLGSMRILFYNQYTRNASTSAEDLRETSVSLLFLDPKKAANMVWGEDFKSLAAGALLRPRKKKAKTGVHLQPCTIQEYSAFYEGWAKESEEVHTPRTREYLQWRFNEAPETNASFHSVWRGEELIGCLTLIHEEAFESYQLNTVIVSDYMVDDSDPQVFKDAVSTVVNDNAEADLIAARAFTTPEYQRSLMGLGFLDSMHFPLNRFVKPGGLGFRLYDERCRDFGKHPWYLCHSDCF